MLTIQWRTLDDLRAKNKTDRRVVRRTTTCIICSFPEQFMTTCKTRTLSTNNQSQSKSWEDKSTRKKRRVKPMFQKLNPLYFAFVFVLLSTSFSQFSCETLLEQKTNFDTVRPSRRSRSKSDQFQALFSKNDSSRKIAISREMLWGPVVIRIWINCALLPLSWEFNCLAFHCRIGGSVNSLSYQ